MSNDLFNLKWEKKPRIYYKAVSSTGAIAIRGSSSDVYSYACLRKEVVYPNEVVFATFHSTEQLAKYQCNRFSKHNEIEYEVVALEKITAREARQLKKLDRISLTEYVTQKHNTTETELENV